MYVPYLIGPPVRICTERAIGPHAQELMAASEQARRSLWCAPLDADASGLAVLACLEETGPMSATLARIRERGHAISASPLEGRDAVSAPLWRGGTVVGSVTLLVFQPQMRSTGMRGRYVNNVLASAAGMSEQLSPSVLPRGADRLPA